MSLGDLYRHGNGVEQNIELAKNGITHQFKQVIILHLLAWEYCTVN